MHADFCKGRFFTRVRKIRMCHRITMAPRTPPTYTGYLAPHLDLIVAAHQRGLSPHLIAERLFAAGARAQTSDPNHIADLRAMTLYVLRRLGLRQQQRRRRRQLTARPRQSKDGTVVWEVKA